MSIAVQSVREGGRPRGVPGEHEGLDGLPGRLGSPRRDEQVPARLVRGIGHPPPRVGQPTVTPAGRTDPGR